MADIAGELLWRSASQGLPLPPQCGGDNSAASFTVLHVAIWNDHEVTVAELLDRMAQQVPPPVLIHPLGGTPLMHAARHGSVRVAAILLQHRADIHARHDCGHTAASFAACNGHSAVLRMLLQAKAAADVPLHFGVTVDCRPIHLATCSGHTDTVDLLLRANVRLDAHDGYGMTPTSYAVQSGQTAVLQNMLKARADVNAADLWTGSSLVEHAAKRENLFLLRLLLRAKADVSTHSRNGLHLAASLGRFKVVKLLLQAKANVGALDEFGRTVLHMAADNKRRAVVKLLVRAKARVDVQSA